ncbi:hypothetical protein RJZ57_004498 [Blastomyces gilchristii]
MVDPAHFKETNPNYKKPSISEPSRSATDIWLFLDVEGTTEISTDVIKSIGKESADMAGDDVLLCNPTVLGFSLDKKLWHKHHDSLNLLLMALRISNGSLLLSPISNS